MHVDRNDPPPNWHPDTTHRLTDEIYYGWHGQDTKPLMWHWCPTAGCWRDSATGNHLLITRDPLHLEPSLLWPCCGTHGWVRAGIWVPA